MNKVLKSIISVLILVLVIFIVFLIKHLNSNNATSAYIETNVVRIVSNVSGSIQQVNISDDKKIKKGQILAQIKPDNFIEKLDKLNDSLIKKQQDLKNVEDEYAKLNVSLTQKNAEFKKAAVDVENAHSDYYLYKNLYKDGAATKDDFDKASKNVHVAANNFKQAQDELKNIKNSISNIKAKKDGLAKSIDELIKEIDESRLDLENTAIISPIEGTIANNTFAVGKTVQKGSELAIAIPKDGFLSADITKKQAKDLKVGQIVTIKIKELKNAKIKGKIESIKEGANDKISVKIIFTNESLNSTIPSKMLVKAVIKPI